MRYLVDTQLLLWAAGEPERLSAPARELIGDEENTLFFSSASIWEIVIKTGLGREDFVVEPRLFRHGLLENGYVELPVSSEHALAVLDLPKLHKDPFDRMLIAQATTEGMLLATADETMGLYAGDIVIV